MNGNYYTTKASALRLVVETATGLSEYWKCNNAEGQARETAPTACPSSIISWTTLREKQRQLPVLRALWTTLCEKQHQLPVLRALCYEQRSARNRTNCLSFERYVLNNAPLETVPIACFSSVMLWTTLREKQRQLPVLRASCYEQRSAKNSANCLSFSFSNCPDVISGECNRMRESAGSSLSHHIQKRKVQECIVCRRKETFNVKNSKINFPGSDWVHVNELQRETQIIISVSFTPSCKCK